jgi:calcineurin-like phosphoesterase family protein
MSKIFFCADTHFGSQRTLELSRRPFDSVRSMDTALRQNWNDVITETDTVYHLGDFGDPKMINYLNGAKIQILVGNYDDETVQIMLMYDRRGRVKVYNTKKPFKLTGSVLDAVGLPELSLVHEPENAVDSTAFYLYGHIHQLQMVKRNGLNVGVDCHQFKPIGLEVVKFYHTAITEHYDRNVFMPELGG